MNPEERTVTEMVALLATGDVYKTITARVVALEKQHRNIGAVIRLSFDLPVRTWGAYVSVWVDEGRYGHVCYTNLYGAITAAAAIDALEKAFQNEFWKNAPKESKACSKCSGLGIECYADPVDNDYHLRPCDCPTGRARKYEVEEAPLEVRLNKPPEKLP